MLGRLYRRVGGWGDTAHLARIGFVDGNANLAGSFAFTEHADHVTRDPEAHASSGCHRVKHGAAVGVDLFDVAVAVVEVVAAAAATKARYVPRQRTAGELKLIEATDVAGCVFYEVGPHDLCRVGVGFVGGDKSGEPGGQVRSRRTSRSGS